VGDVDRRLLGVRLTAVLRHSLLTTFVTLIAGALAPSIPVTAGLDPAGFINNLAYQLQVVSRNTSPAERQREFRELFDEDFDVPSLGRFVLGRLSQIMTAQEQQEFLGLFENYVVVTYSDRLSEYLAEALSLG
jgi:phospholipid transport system substrate-binding protein